MNDPQRFGAGNQRQQDARARLFVARTLWFAFSMTHVMFPVVAWLAETPSADTDAQQVLAIVLGLGLLALVSVLAGALAVPAWAAAVARRRGGNAELVFQVCLFRWAAFEFVSLLGFVVAFLYSELYAAGFFAVGMLSTLASFPRAGLYERYGGSG